MARKTVRAKSCCASINVRTVFDRRERRSRQSNRSTSEFITTMTTKNAEQHSKSNHYAGPTSRPTVEQLAAALDDENVSCKPRSDELVASYALEERGVEGVAPSRLLQMYTKPQHHYVVRRFLTSLRPPLAPDMSPRSNPSGTSPTRTGHRPVNRPRIRSVNTSGVLKTLLDKRLVTTSLASNN